MSVKINSPKFTTPQDGATPVENSPNIDQQLEQRAEAILADLENAHRNLLEEKESHFQDMSLEDQAACNARLTEMEAIMAEIEADLDYYRATGVWRGGGVGSMPEEAGVFWNELPEMGSGWQSSNTEIQYLSKEDDPEAYEEYEIAVASQSEECGGLAGVIEVPKGSINPDIDTLEGSAIAFNITDDDDVVGVTWKTVGKDIWCTIEHEDGTKETYILRDLAIRDDVMIYSSAKGCVEKSVTMDATKLVKPAIGSDQHFSENDHGIIMIGGSGDDILLGSQNRDAIYGGEGDDIINGGYGDDMLYGDTVTFDAEYGYPISENLSSGGKDTIYGGGGMDSIFGGGGIDTALNDPNQPGGVDTVHEVERDQEIYFTDYVSGSGLEALKNDLYLEGWEADIDEANGEVVITQDHDYAGTGNDIHIDIPDGYTMAYAENDGSDMVITLVKVDTETGEPSYLRVRIKNVVVPHMQATIKIKTSGASTIIDAHRLESGSNTVVLQGRNGDDALIGPKTNLDKYHITASDLGGSSTIEIQPIMTEIVNDDGTCNWGHQWYDASSEAGYIVLKPQTNDHDLALSFDNPTNYGQPDAVFYDTQGDDLYIYVVWVTDQESGEFEMLKIKVEGGAGTWTDANGNAHPVVDMQAIDFESVTALPIGTTKFEGSAGDDLIVGSIGSTESWGTPSGNDTIIKGFHPTTWRPSGGADFGVDDGFEYFKDKESDYEYEGEVLLWGDEAPADPTRTVWDMAMNGEDPTAVPDDPDDPDGTGEGDPEE